MDTPEENLLLRIPKVVGVFPIQDHIFLPDLPTPYYITNESERRLIEDLIDRPEEERWLCIPRLSRPTQDDITEVPPFESVATVGLMVNVVKLSERHYHIVVRGVFRARLVEVPSDKPYRTAYVEPLLDLDVLGEESVTLGDTAVLQLLTSLAHQLGDAFEGIAHAVHSSPDLSTALYRLGAIFVLDLSWRQRLLEARCLEDRIAIVENALAAALALGLGTMEACDA